MYTRTDIHTNVRVYIGTDERTLPERHPARKSASKSAVKREKAQAGLQSSLSKEETSEVPAFEVPASEKRSIKPNLQPAAGERTLDAEVQARMFLNCAFIEPLLSVIKTMTYPSDSEQRSPVITGRPSRYNGTPMTLQRDTSKSTLEIKTKNISGEQSSSDSSSSLFPDNTVPKKEETPWKAGYRALSKVQKSSLFQRAGLLAGLPEKDVAGRTAAAAKALFEKEWKS